MIWVVGVGGILGAVCRYLLALVFLKKTIRFPFGTWIANLSGTFFLGCIFALHLSQFISEAVWMFMGIGFLGSYTTMSTFGYEVVLMLEGRKLKHALFYITTSLAFGLFFAWAGYRLILFIQNY